MEYAHHSSKADQLERDLGIPHPARVFRGALRRRDDYHEVTPLHAHVARERIGEIEARGYTQEDAWIVLLMRGARIEAIAKAAAESVENLAEMVRARLRQIEMDDLLPEAYRELDLARRA